MKLIIAPLRTLRKIWTTKWADYIDILLNTHGWILYDN